MSASPFRTIPSVDRVLEALGDIGLPRPIVVDAVRREFRLLRQQTTIPAFEELLDRLRVALAQRRASRLQVVINGTGILIHTNFGRAPLGDDTAAKVAEIASSYNTLEYGVDRGDRGGRGSYVEHALTVLCAADAAAVVNNNAAALVLLVRHFCRPDRNEVVISRGELIQIGGGFRIPEILESSGARLCEIGTTNKTSLTDYTRALSKRTALILRVHRSNFFIDGFVGTPSTRDIAVLARQKRTPFVEDLGSGAMFDTSAIAGLGPEPTPRASLRQGVDAVCFSADKLLGGPQAGVIVGRTRIVTAVKREPLFRAFRCDKLTLAALETTVDLHLAGGSGVPVIDMLRMDMSALKARAGQIVTALEGLPMSATEGVGEAQIGGGALPRSSLPSVTVDLQHHRLAPQALAALLRSQPMPVVGYVARGVLRLDLRTIFPRQDASLVAAIRAAAG